VELQERHTELDEAELVIEYVPAEQSIQAADEVASGVCEYFPLAQPLHAADPELENVPFGHGEQVAEFAPDVLPAGHAVHSVVPLADENEPPLHDWHALEAFAPDTAENFPAVHKVQIVTPPKE
jgi:hypothetical protein